MKSQNLSLALIICQLLLPVTASAHSNPKLTPLINFMPEKAFIPPGFDDNDNAEIVVTGRYPSTCYKQGPTSVRVDRLHKKIYISHVAYYYDGCWCLQTDVDYQDTVPLGILAAGKYQIVATDNQGREHKIGLLPIAIARSNKLDNWLYASIDQAYVNKDNPDDVTLSLSGDLPGSCTYLEEVKVLHRIPNVVEVLPIVAVQDESNCQPDSKPFETQVHLDLPRREAMLVHIRSLNGKAINRVVRLK